jgi:hypothetical protein
MSRMKLPIDSITWDPNVTPRIQCDPDVVVEYQEIQRTEDLPPIHVYFDGKVWWGADGRHRWTAKKNAGAKEIACEVHKGTKDDAIWFAAQANLRHGVRLTSAQKRTAVLNILSSPQLSLGRPQSAIAQHCGVAGSFVSSLARQLARERDGEPAENLDAEPASDAKPAKPPRTVRVRTRTGKEYDLAVDNLGHKATGRPTKRRLAAMKKRLLKDGLGQPVPDWLKQVAIDTSDVEGLSTMLSKATAMIEKVHNMPSGAGQHIDLKKVVAKVHEIQLSLQAARFWCACPECRPANQARKVCDKCGGAGWLTQVAYDKAFQEGRS